MNRADPDLVAVRDLPPGAAPPTDESVSRTWHAMTRRQAPPARSRLRRWVPAAAALVVAGLAATGVVLIPDGGADPGIGVGTAPSAPVSPKAGDRPPGAAKEGGVKNNPAPPVGPAPELGASTPLHARQTLDRLAAKAAGSPTETVQPGQLIYTRMYGVTSGVNIGDDSAPVMTADETELWFRPEGMTPAMNIRNGAETHVDPDAGPVDTPYIWQPTPEWLAALPTQPAALRKELLEGIHNSKSSDDHTLSKEIGELLVSSEPLLRADVRVAMLTSIKNWKGLSARETVFDGKQVWAIRQTEQGRFNELLFDPATGRAVGRADGIGDTVGYQVLWTHKLVGKAGER